MPRILSDYSRQKKQEEVKDPAWDSLEPSPRVQDRVDSGDWATGYHYDEGLQYVDSSGRDSEGSTCGSEYDTGPQSDDVCEVQPPALDMNPFEEVPGYYPEGGNYHQDIPVALASLPKLSKEEEEYPFSLQELVKKYEKVEKIPFQIQLGGKLLEVVLGDDKDLYIIYEMQQQVIYGVKELEQAPLLSRVLALLVELWPTSVFEVENVPKLRSAVMKDFVEWYLEYGDVSSETVEAAQAFIGSLET